MTTPNKLTILRIALIPAILLCLWADFPLHVTAAGALFLVASATDWLDGFLARRGQGSKLGVLLDPLADKLLVYCTLLAFADAGWYPLWLALLALSADMLSDSLRNFGASQGVIVPANMWGKVKTAMQMVSLLLAFMVWIRVEDYADAAAAALGWIAPVLMGAALLFGAMGVSVSVRRYSAALG